MFQKDLAKALIGQDITTGPPSIYGMARCLLEGAALSKFDKSALAHRVETMLNYEDVLLIISFL
jgi:hypothetical protein